MAMTRNEAIETALREGREVSKARFRLLWTRALLGAVIGVAFGEVSALALEHTFDADGLEKWGVGAGTAAGLVGGGFVGRKQGRALSKQKNEEFLARL